VWVFRVLQYGAAHILSNLLIKDDTIVCALVRASSQKKIAQSHIQLFLECTKGYRHSPDVQGGQLHGQKMQDHLHNYTQLD
jgi:hypothetical protein